MAANSGIDISFQPDLAESAAGVAAGMAAALSATAAAQIADGRFISEYGAAVVGGHGDVVGPGGSPPDNDLGGPDELADQ